MCNVSSKTLQATQTTYNPGTQCAQTSATYHIQEHTKQVSTQTDQCMR